MSDKKDHCKIFKPTKDLAESIIRYFPRGVVFNALRKNDTVFRNLIEALVVEFSRFEQSIFETCIELDPNRTEDLIRDWETSVGIPDECFSTDDDLESRRLAVLFKLRGLRIQTEQDFIDMAALFGEVIIIIQGGSVGVYPAKYPMPYLGGAKAARNTIIVFFPEKEKTQYPRPYPVPYFPYGIVECLILRYVPATTRVIFKYQGDVIFP